MQVLRELVDQVVLRDKIFLAIYLVLFPIFKFLFESGTVAYASTINEFIELLTDISAIGYIGIMLIVIIVNSVSGVSLIFSETGCVQIMRKGKKNVVTAVINLLVFLIGIIMTVSLFSFAPLLAILALILMYLIEERK